MDIDQTTELLASLAETQEKEGFFSKEYQHGYRQAIEDAIQIIEVASQTEEAKMDVLRLEMQDIQEQQMALHHHMQHHLEYHMATFPNATLRAEYVRLLTDAERFLTDEYEKRFAEVHGFHVNQILKKEQ